VITGIANLLTPSGSAKGNAKVGTFLDRSGIFSIATSGDSVASAAKWGDNLVVFGCGSEGSSLANSQGIAASAGEENFSVASTKMITNSASRLLLDSNSSETSNALIRPTYFSMDLGSVILKDGDRMAGIRNGTEAFAVIGSSRAYKNGDDVVAVSSGTGCAGITGNKVWVNDSQHGSASAELCDCTTKQRGKRCWCECHGGISRRH
jgi:hypothetical protein